MPADVKKPLIKKIGSGLQKGYRALPRIFKTMERLEIFGAEQAANFLSTYKESFNAIDGKLKCTDLLKDYKDNRTALSRFKDVKGPDDKPLSEKLSASDAPAQHILEQLGNVLKIEVDSDADKAIKQFEKDVAKFNASVNKEPPQYTPSEIASEMQKFRTKLKNAMEEQQKQETAKLDQLLSDNNSQFVTNLAAKMGATAPSDIEKIKGDLKTTLGEKHTKELEKVDQSLDAQVKSLHDLADKENRRIAYFAAMYNTRQSKGMRKAIDDWHQANYQSDADVEIELDADKESAKFKGLKFENLALIQTITGRKVNYSKQDGTDTFQIDLPRIGLYYYRSRHQQVAYDLTSIAQAVRAAGHDKITMSVKYHDQEYAMELGRKAYEAALKAGFEPPDPKNPKEKHIAIKVNDKLVDVEELFKSNPKRREKAELEAREANKLFDSAVKKVDPWGQQKALKQALTDNRPQPLDNNLHQPLNNTPP